MSVFARVGEFFKRVGRWTKNHRLHTIVISGIILITAASGITYALLNQPLPKPDTTPIPVKSKPKDAPKYYSFLDGTQVTDETATKSPVTAIMIENSPEARPQSGIKQAQVVYEAIAEGGITRFLCLYQQNKPSLIGPVRSLRMYYLDWAAPYQPGIAHIGGSAAALAEVRNGSYRDLDQFFNAGSYWRATDRYAPHNVYTSFDKLDALTAAKGYATSQFTSFARTDGKPASTKTANSIDVTISGALFNSHYDYDATTNTYKRSEGGAPHNDREQGQIAPSVVVVLDVDMSLVMEDGYRENITTTGSGRATVFQNGTAEQVTWSKAGRMDPLKLSGPDGKDFQLNRGQTWITAVPKVSGSLSWQ